MVLLLTAGVLYSATRGRHAGAQEKEAARKRQRRPIHQLA